jgi:hypothetical protein
VPSIVEKAVAKTTAASESSRAFRSSQELSMATAITLRQSASAY